VAKLTRLTQKIAIQLQLVAESCYHLQFLLQVASPETFGYTLICLGLLSHLFLQVFRPKLRMHFSHASYMPCPTNFSEVHATWTSEKVSYCNTTQHPNPIKALLPAFSMRSTNYCLDCPKMLSISVMIDALFSASYCHNIN
jgi:hypothetical protein